MTVHSRGYQRLHGERTRRGPRFLPIWFEGFRDAVRSRGYFWMRLLVTLVFVGFAIALYLEAGAIGESVRRIKRAAGGGNLSDFEAARGALVQILVWFHTNFFTSLFIVLATLFVGAGLVAEDLRARALALYLVRPITPLDYYLGKILIPVSVLAILVLAPGVTLVLLAALLRPGEETLPFLWQQADILGGLVVHFAFLALSYSSVVLLFSCWTARRISAIVLGAIVFFGAGFVGLVVWRLHGPLVDGLRALSPVACARRILHEVVGREPLTHGMPPEPSVTATLVAWALTVAFAAWIVTQRARTTEVVS